ncbi:MAG: protein BatD [Sedimentisphaerales bacterium]|nr:protein BatD [Sedimentisphaerales bacterium]
MLVILAYLALLAGHLPAARAQQLSVAAAVSSQDVFRGESLVLQIQIEGSDAPGEPDLSGLTNVQVAKLGGQTRNSEAITILPNGKMERQVRRGYVFSYRLTPQQAGRLDIPPIPVTAEGRTLRTRPLVVQVNEPQESDDSKLRVTLSRSQAYVGEAITWTVTWYLSQEARNPQFAFPVLQDDRFRFYDPTVEMDPAGKYYRLAVGGQEVIARAGRGSLEGKDYYTITFSKVLVPHQAGRFNLPEGTVAFEALIGYRRSRSLFDDFFSDDFFGQGQRGVYQKTVIPSNTLTLEVRELPREGRPDHFAGHIGSYRLRAAATPTQATVGEPITLTVTLTGPAYLDDIELPPLNRQADLARDFKIPEEMAPGQIQDKTKIFTQTIRATRPDVRQIPPIELAYFDPQAEEYRIARTEPIPVTIKATRVVTAQDAEGVVLPAAQSELKEWSQGIAYNYEDLGVLENQQYGLATLIRSPVWMAASLVPPAAYLGLLIGATTVRRRRADPAGRRAKAAYATLRKQLKQIPTAQDATEACRRILEGFQDYLGSKLHLAGGAITYRDVEGPLGSRGADAETLCRLRQLFTDCEAAHYAGHVRDRAGVEALRSQALRLAQGLEGRLK